jgi:selenocysteine lyase/cysteine desulfurase
VEFYDGTLNVLSSDPQGNLLMKEIETQLKECPTPNIFVTVSAASNVTSTITDLKALNEIISTKKII